MTKAKMLIVKKLVPKIISFLTMIYNPQLPYE